MKTSQPKLLSPKSPAWLLSSALVVVTLVQSAVGVFFPAIFRDPPMPAGNAQGTDVVILFVAIPTLVISMLLTARGSLRAQMVWVGTLSHLLYNAVLFAFAVAFNSLFLLYVVTLSLALWSLVALLFQVDVESSPRPLCVQDAHASFCELSAVYFCHLLRHLDAPDSPRLI